MKKMRIEKSLLFQDPVEKVLTLKVSEGFTYKQEEDGIRATGPLFIRGIYENDEQHKFQEILEMDVLAPNEKLSGESFSLEIGEYQATPSSDGIDVLIMMNIHGLLEENETKKVEKQVAPQPQPIEVEAPRHASKAVAEVVEEEPVQEEVMKEEENSDQAKIEDLFEDANNVYTSYRIIVAKPNDTYETIAQRYQVEESSLRTVNANKAIQSKTLIILP